MRTIRLELSFVVIFSVRVPSYMLDTGRGLVGAVNCILDFHFITNVTFISGQQPYH